MNYWAQKKVFNFPLPDRLDLTLLLRGILAIMVVWWHTNGYRITNTPIAFLNIAGRICVWVFFILSGYTIGYAFEKKRYQFNTKEIFYFYKNRLVRIYPLLLFITVLSFFINTHFSQDPIPWTSSLFMKEFLMLQWNHTY